MKGNFLDKQLNNFSLKNIDGGYVKLNNRWNANDVISPFNRLYIVESGEGILHIDGKTIKLEPGNAYLIPTDTKFDYACENEMTKLYVHFNIILITGQDALEGLNEIKKIPLSKEDLDTTIELFFPKISTDILLLRAHLTKIVALLLKEYDADVLTQKTYSQIVKRTMEYINKNLSASLTVAEISQEFFVASVTLHKKFKTETGMTIGKYIDNLIFFKARLMLAETKMSIKEISAQLGFCDQFYFSRRFRQQLGMSPQKYRAKIDTTEYQKFYNNNR